MEILATVLAASTLVGLLGLIMSNVMYPMGKRKSRK